MTIISLWAFYVVEGVPKSREREIVLRGREFLEQRETVGHDEGAPRCRRARESQSQCPWSSHPAIMLAYMKIPPRWYPRERLIFFLLQFNQAQINYCHEMRECEWEITTCPFVRLLLMLPQAPNTPTKVGVSGATIRSKKNCRRKFPGKVFCSTFPFHFPIAPTIWAFSHDTVLQGEPL